jgi:hypothetical protein
MHCQALLIERWKELDPQPRDIATTPAGHEGWVVDDEPATMFDFGGVAKHFDG